MHYHDRMRLEISVQFPRNDDESEGQLFRLGVARLGAYDGLFYVVDRGLLLPLLPLLGLYLLRGGGGYN